MKKKSDEEQNIKKTSRNNNRTILQIGIGYINTNILDKKDFT